MADRLHVDPDALESLGRGLRASAEELRAHAERFRARCDRSGPAYGNLPEADRVASQHLANVTHMSDHLDERINRLHAQADYLGTVARTYRDARASALDAIDRQASRGGA